jgi:hypothetical protein
MFLCKSDQNFAQVGRFPVPQLPVIVYSTSEPPPTPKSSLYSTSYRMQAAFASMHRTGLATLPLAAHDEETHSLKADAEQIQVPQTKIERADVDFFGKQGREYEPGNAFRPSIPPGTSAPFLAGIYAITAMVSSTFSPRTLSPLISAQLRASRPRIPLVKIFHAFSAARPTSAVA